MARALLGAARSYAALAWWGLAAPRLHERAELVLVQAVLVDARGVLLAMRSDLRGWELPGGAREPGEDDATALRRELREELGVAVEIERRVGEWTRSGFRPHRARIYRCRLASGEPHARGDETLEARFFAPDAVPEGLFPWYREPLALALADPPPAPVVRREHQGLGAVLAGARIDLRSRLGG